MTTGVIRFNGATVYYEISGDKVLAHEVGNNVELRSAELLAAIEADIAHQRSKEHE